MIKVVYRFLAVRSTTEQQHDKNLVALEAKVFLESVRLDVRINRD